MKPGTFTQMYVQVVFSPKSRQALLTPDVRFIIFEYMSGILTTMNHKSLIINGYTYHVHILFGLNPNISVSDTVHDLKRGSSLFINKERIFQNHFSWQDGYGGFTYSNSQINDLYLYIQNQEEHHRKRKFKDEYLELLETNDIAFCDEYLFEFFE